MTNEPEIEALLRQAQTGDRRSQDLLLGWLRQRIKPWAQRQLQQRRVARLDASDVAQEVCLRVHNAFHRLYDDCAIPQFLGLVRTILHNVVADCGRRRPEVAGDDLLAGVADDTTAPDHRAMRRERQERLEQTLQRLPQEQRRAFQLRFREGLTFQEVGRRRGVSLGHARVLFLRAAERLRAELEESR